MQKSPLLTTHRLSTVSLDEVNLAGTKDDENVDPAHSESKQSPPPLPSRDSGSTQSSRLQGLSGNLPSVPWGSPPTNKTPAPPPPAPRRFPGPFSWLSRGSGASTKSPPVSTNGQHDGADADSASVGSKKPTRHSLKDQFKMLRMREEQTPETDEASVASGAASISQSPEDAPSIAEGEDATPHAALSTSPTSTINNDLAPGTVSGISTSATDASAPVDWELWQQLVNNGPQAVNGTNSEELNAAIKRGIPQTIRGVIWQVLADSRNLELEEVYRELVVRGTDKDSDSRRPSNGQVNGNSEIGSQSSRTSVRSGRSSATPSNAGTSLSPAHELDPEKLAKEQADAETARKKKAKDEAAVLQKLEKTIRRDLGARTSYSKYFVSQGNQESLFGLCKAYALYDEGVGYAQGMNFIAAPLLFNVSTSIGARAS